MTEPFVRQAVSSHEEGLRFVERLVAQAAPESVFGKPAQVGDETLITASEQVAAGGYGFGVGGMEAAEKEDTEAEGGSGGGGGGGGYALGRPVAVISVGPQGVRITPVIDQTKVALAFLTMLGTLLVLIGRMRQASRDSD